MFDPQLTLDQKEQLNRFVKEAYNYNKTHNLFVRDSEEAIYNKDIKDCWPALEHIKKSERVLDIGTGAGFPGMIIAIAKPDAKVTLAESNKKKTYFLKKTIKKLELVNVSVEENHIKNTTPIGPFDVITARAFSHTQNIINICNPMLKPNGKYLLLKGKATKINEEIKSINKKEHKCEIIRVKNKYEERHILLIKKIN